MFPQPSVNPLCLAWSFSHKLELACMDSFNRPLFKDIDEMLLHIYYLSPKKSKELEAVGEELKDVFYFLNGRNLLVRCQETRCKCRALQRIVDRHGAYIAHLNGLLQ